jgi:hypothetical protein
MRKQKHWTKKERLFIESIVKCVDFDNMTDEKELLITNISDLLERGTGGIKLEIDRSKTRLNQNRLFSGNI